MDHASVKCKTKPLENNIAKKLDDLGHGEDILDLTPKAWSMQEIIDKLNIIKIKIFFSVQNNVKRMKKTNHILGGNICKRHIW